MSLPRSTALTVFLLTASLGSASAQTPLPDAIAAPGETVVLTLHAEGAQVYECKAASDGKLAWAFREPIATLAARRQDRRPALRRADLGTHRLQRRRRQGGRQRARRDGERYSLAEADRDLRARHRHPLRRHHGAADQYDRRQSSTASATRRAPLAARPTPPITCSCARVAATLSRSRLRRLAR